MAVTIPGISSSCTPKMVVFDLGYTLWPFQVGYNAISPFQKNRAGKITDSRDRVVKYYAEAPRVLKYLASKKIKISIASKGHQTYGVMQLLHLFGWNGYFHHKEIYPGSKTKHLIRISKASHVPLEKILFFDDEHINIAQAESLGIVSIIVKRGMTMQILMDGLKKFSNIRC